MARLNPGLITALLFRKNAHSKAFVTGRKPNLEINLLAYYREEVRFGHARTPFLFHLIPPKAYPKNGFGLHAAPIRPLVCSDLLGDEPNFF
jgi:hypothetical protein